jgi:hypothetical protein
MKRVETCFYQKVLRLEETITYERKELTASAPANHNPPTPGVIQ